MKEKHASSSEMEFILKRIGNPPSGYSNNQNYDGDWLQSLLQILNCFDMFDISLRYADVMFW